MTRKSRRDRLPRLETPEEHEHLRRKSPADLRGANYSRIQDKDHNKSTAKEKVELMPKLDNNEEHPLPYYVTAEVTLPALAEVPWQADEKRKLKAQADRFNRDTRLQNAVVAEVVNDTIQDEITSVASITLSESKYEAKSDRKAAGLLEKEFVMPEVQHQVYLTVWSLLYEMGRSLPHKEYLKLKEREDELILEPAAKQALLSHVQEGDNWADDLTEEKILSQKSWEVLVFHYHKNLQENALSNNAALKVLQKKLITQAAGGTLVSEELLDLLKKDLIALDEKEKVTTPPRQG